MNKDLARYAFFQKLPADVVQFLNGFLEEVVFQPRESLLSQGESNTSMYVLLQGTIEVRVDGEIVAVIDQPGDVLGEMSALEGRTVTADLVAVSQVQCLEVVPEGVEYLKSRADGMVEVYRKYSELLASRLVATNDKAKFVEKTATELALAKDRLEELNKKLVEKVQSTVAESDARQVAIDLGWVQFEENIKAQGLALETLRNLSSQDLPFLLSELKTLRQSVQKDRVEQVDACMGRLSRLSSELVPLVEMLNEDFDLQERSVLILLKSRKDLIMIKMALAGLGVHIEGTHQLDQLAQEIEGHKFDLLITDLQEVPSEFQVGHILRVAEHDREIFIDQLPASDQFEGFSSLPKGHRAFVVKAWQGFSRAILSSREVALTSYLSRGANTQNEKVRSSTHRAEVLQKCIDHFASFGVRRSYLDRIRTVAEEMLMNAIYDAPIDQNGRSKYNHISRQTSIELEPDECPDFTFGSDGSVLAISVKDPFGALQYDVLYEHWERCYRGDPESADRGDRAGAGRGLHQIIENSDLVSIFISPGRFTQFFAFFHLDPVNEDFGPRVQILQRQPVTN